jgi:DNA-binding transcriptional LysR family regulator
MDRFHEMEVFIAVAEAGSFAKAGQRLRISPPAVTRAVSAIEDRLGVRLINRTTRSLSLTESGQVFLESAKRLLSELDELEKEAGGRTAIPAGHLVVTAPVTFGRIALAPLMGEFLTAHPRITVSLLLLDRVVNLVDEGVDIGIRIADLPDSSMAARRVGEVRRVLVASPDYLAKRGAPKHPAELKHHSVIGFTGLAANRELHFRENGKAVQIGYKPLLEMNDAGAAIAAAEAGHGIAASLCHMAGAHVRSERLHKVLEPFWPASTPVHLVQ